MMSIAEVPAVEVVGDVTPPRMAVMEEDDDVRLSEMELEGIELCSNDDDDPSAATEVYVNPLSELLLPPELSS